MTKRRSLAGLAIILSTAFVLLVPAVASAQIVAGQFRSVRRPTDPQFQPGVLRAQGTRLACRRRCAAERSAERRAAAVRGQRLQQRDFRRRISVRLRALFEAGVGVGYYQRTVPSVFANVTHADGGEITQDLKLRTIPISFTARFLPIGRGSVEPYIGAGLVAIPWRYSEVGEFVDFDGTIFPAAVHRRRNGGRPDDSRRRPRPGWQLRRRRRGPVAEGRGEWAARRRIPRGQAGSRRLDDELHFRVPLLTFVSAGDEANGARR